MSAFEAGAEPRRFLEDPAEDDFDDSESSVSSYDDEQASAGPAARAPAAPSRVPPLALGPPPGAAPKPAPRVPLLGLRLPLAREGQPGETPRAMAKPDAPALARKPSAEASGGDALPPKPPRLNLGSVAGEPSPSPKRAAHSGRGARDAPPPLTVSLLSEAFQVPADAVRAGGRAAQDVARQRVAAELEVPAKALRVFELRELRDGGAAEPEAGCSHLAVSVTGSSARPRLPGPVARRPCVCLRAPERRAHRAEEPGRGPAPRRSATQAPLVPRLQYKPRLASDALAVCRYTRALQVAQACARAPLHTAS